MTNVPIGGFRSLLRVIVCLSIVLFSGTVTRSESGSRYIRHTNTNDVVIVFVHGILGDGTETWTKDSSYWPKLISDDPAFASANIFVYEYPTSLWATLSIDELAEHMRLQFAAHDVSSHPRIAFLSHSMGGLIREHSF